MRKSNPIHFLRAIGLVEAVSFLVLLGIAMPLKYVAGMPMAVKVAGWIHGLLFIIFVGSLIQTTLRAAWPMGRSAMVFVAALLPFGPMVIDNRLRRYAREFGERARQDPVS